MVKLYGQPFRLLVHKGQVKAYPGSESTVGIQWRTAPAAQLHDCLQPALEIPRVGKKPSV